MLNYFNAIKRKVSKFNINRVYADFTLTAGKDNEITTNLSRIE